MQALFLQDANMYSAVPNVDHLCMPQLLPPILMKLTASIQLKLLGKRHHGI
jgi:hypothetical protein